MPSSTRRRRELLPLPLGLALLRYRLRAVREHNVHDGIKLGLGFCHGSVPCWPWVASKKKKNGYCGFYLQGKTYAAHRVAWEIAYGLYLDPKTLVCHKCDNTICCNPTHLFLGFGRENVEYMVTKNRNAHGSRCHKAKLTEEEVVKILVMNEQGVLWSRIAERFNVNIVTVRRIFSGRTWRRVTKLDHIEYKDRIDRSHNGVSTLTPDDVTQIRKLCAEGTPQSAVAKLFGVCQSSISCLVNKKTWKLV